MGERAEVEDVGAPWPSERVIDEPVSDEVSRVMFPAPWRVYLNTGNNRARIVDASGETVISGMNILKARTIVAALNRDRITQNVLAALKTAIRVAQEARIEWDAAPSTMRAGKLLIALGGDCPGYRSDIDAIHAAIAKAEGR